MRTLGGGGEHEIRGAAWRSTGSRAIGSLRTLMAVPLPHLFARALGVSWALLMVWVITVASIDRRPQFPSAYECGTDPLDILHPGELLDRRSLGFIVGAHCANPRYFADGHITVRYGGADFDIETTRMNVGGETYFKILSIGGETEP